ncbi:hypothetical protein RJ639_039878 [Escallonia herrerae]|uniref:Uncharacterized protein n=1 Tax=Escallonia herrerae TaxID=1293975 RepID=A0AA88WKS5_9ASTE|nr:hypothetical protein RJ639_039878 [Escallonia herrerae]
MVQYEKAEILSVGLAQKPEKKIDEPKKGKAKKPEEKKKDTKEEISYQEALVSLLTLSTTLVELEQHASSSSIN